MPRAARRLRVLLSERPVVPHEPGRNVARLQRLRQISGRSRTFPGGRDGRGDHRAACAYRDHFRQIVKWVTSCGNAGESPFWTGVSGSGYPQNTVPLPVSGRRCSTGVTAGPEGVSAIRKEIDQWSELCYLHHCSSPMCGGSGTLRCRIRPVPGD
ncbi:hypothetical protein ACTIVE_6285 [Actinomadura verrucosospora]|uniref:Uncharacterized protein n=1 Tax=Actinomadura verrucosospora TaxID=46165 RepID=A0A7D3W2B8_ACTVE|nr:hypothetical protein ACTIVE_6285 [Actinomadura verrucosospora]